MSLSLKMTYSQHKQLSLTWLDFDRSPSISSLICASLAPSLALLLLLFISNDSLADALSL